MRHSMIEWKIRFINKGEKSNGNGIYGKYS